MGKSKIDWTDYSWNPVTGCSKVSAGCANCYAERHAKRFWGERKFTDIVCHEDRLNYPFSIKQPARIFVNSMSDLFHEKVSYEFIEKVVRVIAKCPQHQFIVLTKRPEMLKSFFDAYPAPPNLIAGVSVEDQRSADERVPLLMETNVRYRAISAEPLLGHISIMKLVARQNRILDWVIVGGESGPGARVMDEGWALDLLTECSRPLLGIPFYFKQWGEYNENGVRVGKAAAGHLLNGRVIHEYPYTEGFIKMVESNLPRRIGVGLPKERTK